MYMLETILMLTLTFFILLYNAYNPLQLFLFSISSSMIDFISIFLLSICSTCSVPTSPFHSALVTREFESMGSIMSYLILKSSYSSCFLNSH